MNATIRKARASDGDELLRMRLRIQEHMEASNPGIWRITEEGRRQIWPEVEETLNDEEDRVLVAEEEGIIMGFAHGRVVSRETYTPRTIGHIDTIYVEPAKRRRSIGGGLVRELCEYFRERGVDEVNLRYVLGNEEADGFWMVLGFTPVIQTANTPLEALEERLKRAMKSLAGNRNKQGAP